MKDNPWEFDIDGDALADGMSPEEVLQLLLSKEIADVVGKYVNGENDRVAIVQAMLHIGVELTGMVLSFATHEVADKTYPDVMAAIKRAEKACREDVQHPEHWLN